MTRPFGPTEPIELTRKGKRVAERLRAAPKHQREEMMMRSIQRSLNRARRRPL